MMYLKMMYLLIIFYKIFLKHCYRGRLADALKSALKNAPLGSKNQQLKVNGYIKLSSFQIIIIMIFNTSIIIHIGKCIECCDESSFGH